MNLCLSLSGSWHRRRSERSSALDRDEHAFSVVRASLRMGAGRVTGFGGIGDPDIFVNGGGSIEELSGLFHNMRLPVGTFIVGDVESVLDLTVGIARPGTWRLKDLRSNSRLRRFGFFWIDQLATSQWTKLCGLAAEFVRNQLGAVGETRIVRMWEHPYMRASAAPKLRRLAALRLLEQTLNANFEYVRGHRYSRPEQSSSSSSGPKG